jgi:hypothetical protein
MNVSDLRSKRLCSVFWLKDFFKTIQTSDNRSPGREWYPGPPDYLAGVLIPQSWLHVTVKRSSRHSWLHQCWDLSSVREYRVSMTPALCEGLFVTVCSESLGWETRFNRSSETKSGGLCTGWPKTSITTLHSFKYNSYSFIYLFWLKQPV